MPVKNKQLLDAKKCFKLLACYSVPGCPLADIITYMLLVFGILPFLDIFFFFVRRSLSLSLSLKCT